MHIIETYFECGGFDHRFIQGGTSVYLWQLSRGLADLGHRVSIVTPAHGRLDDLRRLHEVEDLPGTDEYELPLVLDPRVWGERFPAQMDIALRTTAHRIRLAGVDLYFLSNELLDQLPDRFYPPYESKGVDLVFFKPLAYQVAAIRFIRSHFGDQRAIVHAHEPFYHYLMPAAFAADPAKHVVSTVQSNMPINKSVYRAEVARLLGFLGAPNALPADDPAGSRSPHTVAMSQYQQLTHLHYEYPPDHVRVYDLVAEHADRIDFLSPGHRDYYTCFADTPFAQLFATLPVSRTVRRNADKTFVGGCAVGDEWVTGELPPVDREKVLAGLGLDPDLPAFYHNARYAVNHKGQVELIRAVDRVLSGGVRASFIVRCLSDAGIADPLFHEVVARHPGRVNLEWHRVPEDQLREYARAADFCLFPSKFEMDTFLIAQGEAMAAGAVPIATAQLGMAHFGHVADPLTGPDAATATGFAVNRSFAEDDPLLVQGLTEQIRRAVTLWNEQPGQYRRLSANAVARAREFTWRRAAQAHEAAFAGVWAGRTPRLPVGDLLRFGWFDELPADAWTLHRDEIAEVALAHGDADAYLRCRPDDLDALAALFERAWARADFPACARTVELAEEHRQERVPQWRARLAGRGRIDRDGRLHYRPPSAERVELVLPDLAEPLRGTVTVTAMAPTGDTFTGQLPAGTRRADLLLTLSDGRTVWDEVTA
ncbi:glycosyl transferase [Actinoplanes sp. SE50]|uniref:glycogen/starch synthase n=1 Tax=unclassified Actinoplanes TaxID=2626549 RepID=UPI00006CA2D2|nr:MULTISPECIES: glycogen/starch synthase [unclassified Actinoplanes]AEV84564.1 glycosyltransferase [Actinoplanes sp. SE50/110]ATO82956.1 glycosyl transferase [Actinoplanes sp. SE50]CAJ81024.1 glycosyltransferase AcbS [Actinoplanes sp. SE50/110]SLM00364.1 glycosyl transferase [Actinoplanes sp. SE50/110]